jgi:hypothetical protein
MRNRDQFRYLLLNSGYAPFLQRELGTYGNTWVIHMDYEQGSMEERT